MSSTRRLSRSGWNKRKQALPAWLDPFRKFFWEFPLILMGRVALCFDDATSIPEISLWRIAGDEMVFVARPESEQETLFLFESLYQAFRHYHAKLSTDYGLGLKACCWSADFPQKNIAIGIPEIASRGDGSEDAYTEYLGPDVDLGFRIAKHVHGGEAIASLKLAETLARANDRGGRVPLRGQRGSQGSKLRQALPPDHRWIC